MQHPHVPELLSRRRTAALVAVFLLAALLPASAVPLQAVRTQAAPVIDGKLEDACWRAAPPAGGFRVMNTERAAAAQTTAQFAWDEQALYVGVRCAEPNIASIQTRPLPRDNADVFRTDCVEIMLDLTASQNDYFHLAVNASGTLADRACTQGGFVGDMSWDSTATAASAIGADFWSCEFAIPFSGLGISPQVGATWRVNVCREKREPTELSSLAEQGAFNLASRFVELAGIGTDFSRYCYEIGTPQVATTLADGKLRMTLQVALRNLTGKAGACLLDGWLVSPAGKVSSASLSPELPVGQSQDVVLGPYALDEQGDYTCTVRVADPLTKQPLALRQTRQPIQFVPIAITLTAPWYRDCIFATQNLEQIDAEVELRLAEPARQGGQLAIGIWAAGGDTPLQLETVKPVLARNRVRFAVAPLPEGRLELRARLCDAAGTELAATTRPLRKLPRKPGEVWLGRDLQWYVDGKPFFLTGAWNYAEDFVTGYNAFTGERPGDVKLLDTVLMNQLGSRMKSLEQKRLSAEDAELVRRHVLTARDNPKLFAYYVNDEPECSSTQAGALEGVYQVIAEEDPYHPVIISNDSMEGLRNYARCADINGLHPYPPPLRSSPHTDLAPVANFIAGAVAFYAPLAHKQTMAYLHQGFNYGDYGAVNHRIPTYQEYRNQNLLAVICGARGTIQFNRMVAHYPELAIGMPYLTRELAALEPVFVAPDAAATPQADSAKARLLLKEQAGQLWLFVCNAELTAREISFTVSGMGKGGPLAVVSEGRQVAVQGERWTDRFGPFECHIYTTAKAPDLPTVAAITAEIAAANAARRKPGNLAFQEFEGDGVVVSASSNCAGKFQRPDNGLWHVVDGVVDSTDHYACLTWQDTTENQGPDWLEIRLPKPQAIARVVVYPFDGSLRDYSVQAFVGGQWQDLDKAAAPTAAPAIHRFAPVTTDRVRLLVTATNGPLAKVTEVELYGP
jgi:hypothetical protein